MTKEKLSIALLDRQRVFRDGLESLMDGDPMLSVVGSVSAPADLMDCLVSRPVDVVVMELLYPGEDLLRHLEDWSKSFPKVNFLILSQLSESVYAPRALAAGARGFLMKEITAFELMDSIWRVARGEVAVSPAMSTWLLANFSTRPKVSASEAINQLSNRELHVLNLVGLGHSTAEIALAMGISRKTVSSFKERIKVKLDLNNSTQLTQVAMQWLEPFREGADG